jgi:hypothetical protein
MSTLYPDAEALPAHERTVLNLYLVSTLMLFILLMVFGLTMRLAQGAWIAVPPNIFYQIMTAHGAGMVSTVGLASSAVMWFFLRKYVRSSLPIFVANYVFFMLGAGLVLGATFIGQYAGAWTFLYPLPVHAMGVWSVGAAAAFMLGYLLIGVGFLLFYLDAMLTIPVHPDVGHARPSRAVPHVNCSGLPAPATECPEPRPIVPPRKPRPEWCGYFARVILPQAIGNVTCAGMGPREATEAGSLLAAGMPWMKTTRRSRSSFWPSNAFAKAASRALSDTVSRY